MVACSLGEWRPDNVNAHLWCPYATPDRSQVCSDSVRGCFDICLIYIWSVSVVSMMVIFDYCINMHEHVTSVCRAAYYHLKNIHCLKTFLTQESLVTVVHAFAPASKGALLNIHYYYYYYSDIINVYLGLGLSQLLYMSYMWGLRILGLFKLLPMRYV